MPRTPSALRPPRRAAESPDPNTGSLFAEPPAPSNPTPAPKSRPSAFPSKDTSRRLPFVARKEGGGRESDQDGGGAIGFEVRGFATDPKHSGYQILTNYESTYWRAFVGVQEWALYEVLRSFCHNGNNVCYPTINYLLDVLGLKQRRVLTGWNTEVKGKNYEYPGLIETLQTGGLIIAEIAGEGPMLRYLFHVNLTPDLLRPEQVAQLPDLLQNKHAEMLQTHFAEMAELASRRRPAKNGPATGPNTPPQPVSPLQATAPEALPPLVSLQKDENSSINSVETGGMTICHTRLTICHTPSDNLSHKQHQSNNTQLTSYSATNAINNNSGDLQQELLTPLLPDALNNQTTDVVVALTNLGLAESVVQRLTTRFNRERILQKIDYLAYLEELQPNKVKNPRGWLRRAVEENYGPPDGYLTAQERAALPAAPPAAGTASYSSYVNRDEVAASQAAKANAVAEREYQRAARRELIRRRHGPDAATLSFWELVQTDVRFTMTPDHYRLIAEASVLWMDEQRVAVAIWDREIYRELLHPNRVKALTRTMSTLAKRKLDLICEYWDEEGQVVPPGTPPP